MNKRIGLIGENSIEYINNLFDIWNAGHSAVLIDWRIPEQEIIDMLNEAEVSLCYIDKNLSARFDCIRNDNLEIQYYNSFSATATECPETIYQKFQQIYTDNEAVVLYSSGTTGKAKGIILTHNAIQKNADKCCKIHALDDSDCIYVLKPISHSSSLVSCLLVGLKSKARIIVSPSILTARKILKNVRDYNVTILNANPTLMNLFIKVEQIESHDYPSLRELRTSGSAADKTLIQQAHKYFPQAIIYNGYGLTETGPAVAVQSKNDALIKEGAVGPILENVEVKIINSNGEETDTNQSGIIHIKTDTLFKGYIKGAGKKSYYKDWFNSGDIGYLDVDGHLFITGRADNMILVGSHNVFPEAIEKNVLLYSDSILDCVVFGVKNDFYGEKIICYYTSENEISCNIKQFCKKKLASYEIPHQFIRVNKIMYTSSGKKIRSIDQYKEISKEQ